MSEKNTLPAPPYPLRQGMNWDLDRNCVFIFDNGQPVMAISISEIIGEARKLNAQAPTGDQQ